MGKFKRNKKKYTRKGLKIFISKQDIRKMSRREIKKPKRDILKYSFKFLPRQIEDYKKELFKNSMRFYCKTKV